MIMLDTQVWVWWTTQNSRLSPSHAQMIAREESGGIAVSAISVWEVAMLVRKGRLELGEQVQSWLNRVVSIPTLHLIPPSPQILLDSTLLPGDLHNDPADRIIVATARTHASALLTTDHKILAYEHVRSVGPG